LGHSLLRIPICVEGAAFCVTSTAAELTTGVMEMNGKRGDD
jgi:hypothetical protein